jgi:hypothetical protein
MFNYTGTTTKEGYLQAGRMADYLDIGRGTLGVWRRSGKIRDASFIEASEGVFLYNVKLVLSDLRKGEEVLNQTRELEATRCEGCSCNR